MQSILLFVIDEVPDPNIKNIHQDDDGFESLNGNVSSDNDKSAARVPEKFKHKRELLKNNEERILWLEDSTSQQVLQSKFSGLIFDKFYLNISYSNIMQYIIQSASISLK